MFDDPFWISVAQAAELLHISPQRVRTLLRKGYLQGYQATTEGGAMCWRVHASLRRATRASGRPTKRRGSAGYSKTAGRSTS